MAGAILISTITKTVTAKSLYVIADIKGSSEDSTQPVQAYDIGVDGTLTFQAQLNIPHRVLGAVGMAIDADSGFVFVTYEAGSDIQLLEATTLRDAGTVGAPDALDLAGIVYNHKTKRLYCVDRTYNKLYRYDWDSNDKTLTHAEGSPHTLRGASAYGIALDEIDDLLYVGNANNDVTVYSTQDWKLIRTISLSRIAISVALDVKNGFLYTGAGYVGNRYLTQYNLVTGEEKEVQVEPDAGVMGLGVDPDTGLVYMSTGKNNEPGGDNLLVYNSALEQLDIIAAIGNPTGLAIPGKDIGYNPFHLQKSLVSGAIQDVPPGGTDAVAPGSDITYEIYFDNLNNDYVVTGVSIVDDLPDEVEYIATDDKSGGHYDSKTHTYTWTYSEYPPGSTTHLELPVKVKSGLGMGSIITNSVTINSNETPPTTTSLDTIVAQGGLNLTKTILDAPAGKITAVNPNEVVTYLICFNNNKDNGFTATDVVIDDFLPDDVIFLSADAGGKAEGIYDEKAHTYTWDHIDMPPGDASCLSMVVRVNPATKIGKILTNTATIYSNETMPSMAYVDAVVEAFTPTNDLKLTKQAIEDRPDEVVEEIDYVDIGDTFTYKLGFVNESDDELHNVSVVDILPEQVVFLEAITDNSDFTGQYLPKTNTYEGSVASLAPGASMYVKLRVRVKEDTKIDTTIINSAEATSDETLPATASVEVTAVNPLLAEDMIVSPRIIRLTGNANDLLVTVQLPKGIEKDNTGLNRGMRMIFRDSEGFDRVVAAKRQLVSSTISPARIMAAFDRTQVRDLLPGYGEVNIIVKGRYIDGKKRLMSYRGKVTVLVTRFAGD